MGGDGNCFFRAIADQFDGDETKHQLYRKQALTYIKENRDLYEFFIVDDEDFDKYIARLSKDG